MPITATKEQLKAFLALLKEWGGKSGNVSLRQGLGWEEDLYWSAQGQLIKEGLIGLGRGRGGSVHLPESEMKNISTDEKTVATVAKGKDAQKRERDLYLPMKTSIEGKWIKRFGFDEVYVDETHSQGSRDTGGTFTRPDITAAGIRRYVYLPKRLEIVTFEIKPIEAVNITGVLEALAHKEGAHRSYVIYSISRTSFDEAVESERIIELSQKYGIGVILAENPDQVETWEMVLDAARHEPDPARLDRFLSDLPNDAMKKKLSKWKD